LTEQKRSKEEEEERRRGEVKKLERREYGI
jgi:hypothetical protein